MTVQTITFSVDNKLSIAENIIEYVQSHEDKFSSALFSKHDQQDLRYQFATASLNVVMVEMAQDSNSGVITVSYGIHFFWPCNNQDEIDHYKETLNFVVKEGTVSIELIEHEPWIVL